MIPALILAAVTAKPYAATPKAAAIAIMERASHKKPVVVRINVVGRYAMVLTNGGVMESLPVKEPVLLKRFSFGWQPLALIVSKCDLESQHLNRAMEVQLMRSMPTPEPDRLRCSQFRDSGPPAQIEAVRRLMDGPLVPWVVVSGDWAMGSWYGAGGGGDLFHFRGGRWVGVADGGGQMGTEEMQSFGVPRSDWCKFGIYGANCRARP